MGQGCEDELKDRDEELGLGKWWKGGPAGRLDRDGGGGLFRDVNDFIGSRL